SSVWIVPGNIIYLGALAMIIAALGALVSLVSGLLVVLKRPLVLLWLIPEALLFLGIVIYFIIIQ
ncbi:MAG TPA: hypothetical protein PLB62_03860, partial [Candidatus Sumerlaeota bacterium]|nr:hypothetical protein [Candidatus Sumerlaeota bacterium]